MLSPLDLLPQIQELGLFGYWIVLLSSLGESLPFVGLLVPGTVVVLISGFFSSQGYLDVGDLIWFSAIGASLGDWISYRLGKKGVHLFKAENKILKKSLLEKGNVFFHKHGTKSIFFGRFLGPLRSTIPFVAGLSGMSPKLFFFWNVTSAFVWSATYVTLGYFFGELYESIETWTTRVGLVIIGIVILVILIRYMVKRSGTFFSLVVFPFRAMYKVVAKQPEARAFLQAHEQFMRFLRKRFNLQQFSGLPLTTIFFVLIYLGLALIWATIFLQTLQRISLVDLQIHQTLLSLREPILVKVFLWITSLGAWQTALSITLVSAFIWWVWNKRAYTVGFLVSLGGTLLYASVLKVLINRPRPLESIYLETTASFPSAHAALAIAVYGFLAFAALRHLKNWTVKLNAFFACVVMMVLIGLSRLYLGVHFFSDVWNGYILGLVWVVCGVAVTEWLERGKLKSAQPKLPPQLLKIFTLACLIAEIIFVGLFAYYQGSFA